MTSLDPSDAPPLPIWRRAALIFVVLAASIAFAARWNLDFAGIYDETLRGAGDWLGLSSDRLAWTLGATRGEMRRPLHWLALAVEQRASDQTAAPIHVTSRFLAAASCFCLLGPTLVVLVRRRDAWKTAGVMGLRLRKVAAVAMCLIAWLVHPVNVESIACASQQGTVLGGALLAAAAFAWWTAIERADRPRSVLPSLALLLLALLADPTLCFAPAALLALTLHVRRREPSPTTDVARPLAFASVLGALAFVASYAVREPGGGAGLLPSMFATATQVVRPIRSMLWPVGLHPGYDAPPGYPDEIAPSLWIDAATAAALVAVCVWGLRRRHGLGCALLAYLAFVAGRALLGRDEFGADGDAYVATIPLFVAGGVVAARAVGRLGTTRAVVALAAASAVVAVAAGVASAQEAAWKHEETLVARVLAVDPTNERALVAQGDAARRRGVAVDLAATSYRRALDAGDWRPLAHARLGGTLLETGDAAGARAQLERAVAIAPWLAAARFDLGGLELREGRLNAATAQLEAAARLDAVSVDAWRLLAQARDKSGDAAGARDAMRRAAALRPDDEGVAEELLRLGK